MLTLFELVKPKYILFTICVIFLFTRLYKIGEIPRSVYWDEASIGYNSFSILKTGKDEWGDFLPIHFRAFGEFKLPLYIYSTVPFIKLFGLNEFSVRFPAVIFSLGVVILTYFLAKRITESSLVGLWSSFLISISPWFFIFSRTGFEATAGLMFYLLGICLFLNNTKKNFLLFSVLSFILSMYSYNSFRIIVLLSIIILFFSESLHLINKVDEKSTSARKWLILSAAILFISLFPIYRLYVFDRGFVRLQNVGLSSGINILQNYLMHFNPAFLFIDGDNNIRHQQEGFGQLFLPEAFLLPLGIFYLLYKKKKYGIMLLALLLIAPLPASLTKESPHALRSIAIIPFICILSALGASLIKRKLFQFILVMVFLSFFVNYFLYFLTVYPLQSLKEWQYDYKKIFLSLDLNSKEGKFRISEKWGQPYIFALFYLKYDPERFRSEVLRNSPDKWGFSTVKGFGPFEFVN